MTIVYLDAYTLNPGDLDWAPLHALGNVQLYDRTAPEQLLERAHHADVILVNKIRMNRELLSQLPNLRYIGVTATGFDIIDVAAARELGITVTNVRGYSTYSVAQLTFALLLELTLHVGRHNDSVHAGDWVRCPDFSYAKSPLIELAGKTLGLVGYGDIGRKVADIGRAMGMNILVNKRHPDAGDGVQYVDIPTLFAQSDVVSLHCPATPENKGFVNAELLKQMKPSAFLLNTSRGALVNEADLAEALNTGVLAGAGIDVLSVEPPSADNPLLTAQNCIITPHIAWASFEARTRLLQLTIENIKAFAAGSPTNVVN
ncbi:D-2-hydroxyacid dehydrogenase [Rudanella paleaurantiibacter]|uniref:D-2-hydroxyacid dehydrogenase n=1 Tax=Rudanella paleaurantiibacter TaxID=2614655 RepID=A0A7J5U5I9_9BACT|nr:D-2-hydroxyacid dehydrogenase [Rudanella paleaurantiibacter]KAB7732410.1 D-2-hydroxyacid dehydrogenase [Rudanella paleaurantiibacter]